MMYRKTTLVAKGQQFSGHKQLKFDYMCPHCGLDPEDSKLYV